jgi:glycosyltransferase involved in cell wall biosynthesis
LRVITVIPGEPDGNGMIFAKRQVDSLELAGVDIQRFFLASRTSPRMLWAEASRFRKLVGDFQPDLVHAQYGTVTAMFCALSCRCPLVITYRGSDLNHSPSNGLLLSGSQILLSQLAALRARKIICVSRALGEKLVFGRSKVAVVPNGVNLELFAPIDRRQARQELGWAPDKQIVLFNAGRHPKVKRLDRAEAVFREAAQHLDNLEFNVMRGDIPGDRIPLYLNAADCLLVTSEHEGSPNIVKEAMACRLPIVSVDVGDVRERLEGVEPGFVGHWNAQSLGCEVVRCLAATGRSTGRAKAALEVDEKLVVQTILDIYLGIG